MSYEIALVNPRPVKRRRKGKAKVKRNSKGQFVKRASNPRKRRKHAVRASNPKRRKHRKHRASNPRTVVRYRSRRASNPRKRRHRRSNPRFVGMLKHTLSNVVPAGVGALGMIAGDALFSFLPLPDMLKTGYAAQGVNLAKTIAVAAAIPHFYKGQKGAVAAHAVLGIGIYSIVRGLVQQIAPGLPGLSGAYETMTVGAGSLYDPAPMMLPHQPGAGAYMDSGMGAYMAEGVGEYAGTDYEM